MALCPLEGAGATPPSASSVNSCHKVLSVNSFENPKPETVRISGELRHISNENVCLKVELQEDKFSS